MRKFYLGMTALLLAAGTRGVTLQQSPEGGQKAGNKIIEKTMIEFNAAAAGKPDFRHQLETDLKTGKKQLHGGGGFVHFGHIQALVPLFNYHRGSNFPASGWCYNAPNGDEYAGIMFRDEVSKDPARRDTDLRFFRSKENPDWIFIRMTVRPTQAHFAGARAVFNSAWTDFHPQFDKQQGATRHLWVSGKDYTVLKKANPKVPENGRGGFAVYALNSKLLGGQITVVVPDPETVKSVNFGLGGWGDGISSFWGGNPLDLRLAVGVLPVKADAAAEIKEFFDGAQPEELRKKLRGLDWEPAVDAAQLKKLNDEIARKLDAAKDEKLRAAYRELIEKGITVRNFRRLENFNSELDNAALKNLL